MTAPLRERILRAELTDSQLGMFYLGQVGFVFIFRGKYVLIDAYLSGKTVQETGSWGRNYPAPITPEELDFIDIVLCSHDHSDHTDPETLRRLAMSNDKACFIVPAAYLDNVVSYGVPKERLIPARESFTLSFPDIEITPLPSAHEELHQDENGDYFEMGYRFNFGGAVTLYHSGDCCIYEGLAEKVGTVDIACLPVNGRSFYRLHRNVIGNMTLEEAVVFAKEAGAKLFIPLHFDLFPGNTLPPSYIPAAVDVYAKGMPYKIFTPGEGFVYMDLN